MLFTPRLLSLKLLAVVLLAIVAGCSSNATSQTSKATSSAPQTSTSSNAADSPEMALALHLQKSGAKMYGTYWCSVCNWQRKQFGETAFNKITYVECDPGGPNPQPDVCSQTNIRAYPTWEINGRLYPPGGYPLQELAQISGYQGASNFSGGG
ncbi:hypothetical protein K9N68_02540 [Kovacikia minuta CCNUW1]|uniref:hypothetical protein n=1 Tax=Kovacikia minuta TaxID=2931930 RepID=UPI001CCA4D4D|nr:hypothetical protein [Kovacikia minuta]UBF26887.1 hypothetical protein K9N68_02540 [Kovacikia minuta CCNUW1]